MVDKSEVRQRIVKVVCRMLSIDEDTVRDESHFAFDLGAESTQSVELVAAFEEEFDIDMEEDAALQVQTVGGAVDFIADCLD